MVRLLVAYLTPWAHELESVIDASIAALLYVMFLQVPLAELRRGLANQRVLLALATANFIFIPLVAVGLAAALLPDVPVLWLGVLMVLLTPCIDYVVAFTQVAHDDASQVNLKFAA